LHNSKKILLLRPSHQTQKQFQMKKFFAILVVAGFLTACNDGGTAEEAKTDTTAPAAATPDSLTATPDTSALKVDTSKAVVDTTKK
jgi:hypothetical protein